MSISQTLTIDSAPTSVIQGEIINVTATFDADSGDVETVDGQVLFILRSYNIAPGAII